MSLRRSTVALAGLAFAAPTGAQLQFQDVAEAADVAVPTYGRGAAMVDLNGDGLLDLITANDGMDNLFHRQKPNHTFALVNGAWQIPADTRPSWGVVATDFDNDGDVDVYFVNGGFEFAAPNQLLRNDLNQAGKFTDVSDLGDVAGDKRTFGASAADVNADGRVDLFLGNSDAATQILINEGGLVFEDRSASYGVPLNDRNRHTGAGDYNNDGWVDLASGAVEGNLLLRNDGGVGVTDRATEAGVVSPQNNFGFVFHDFDNDAWLDVYLPKYQVIPVTTSRLYLNAQDGTFNDVTDGSGMTGQDDMGHGVFDLDADGLGEVFIGTGNPSYLALDLLYSIEPDGAGGLDVTDLSGSSGIQAIGLTRNHGMAFGDYDGDGDVDVYANLGGPSYLLDSIQENALWRNLGNENGWIEVELEGVLSNRSGIGARVAAYKADGSRVHAHQQAGMGFSNTPSPILHLGLGASTEVERVEVRWPSGIVQTIHDPAAFSRLSVLETGVTGAVANDVVELELAGEAGDWAQLAYSTSSASIPFPPLGVLALGPPIFPGPALALDSSGRASWSLPVAAPQLMSGQTVFVQAWTYPPSAPFEGELGDPLALVFP